jgi:hypothetical protein
MASLCDILIAWFLGFGVYRWMKGYKTSAIVKLLTFLIGIGFLWWLIDVIFVIIDKPLIWPT